MPPKNGPRYNEFIASPKVRVIDEEGENLGVMLTAEAIEQAADAGGEAGSDVLAGVYAAPDRLVHLLDPWRMIHSLVRLKPQSPERQGASHGKS